jgi:hypothetical protein
VSIMTNAAAAHIAAVERELAEMEAHDAAVAAGLARRRQGPASGPSIVYSIRLDRDEVAALELRAAAAGLKPTVLARNLIRIGLAGPRTAGLSTAVDRLEESVRELRALVP